MRRGASLPPRRSIRWLLPPRCLDVVVEALDEGGDHRLDERLFAAEVIEHAALCQSCLLPPPRWSAGRRPRAG